MGAIMTSDNEVVSFEFYSNVQSSLYFIEFDARFDLDPEGKFGNLLDNFYSLTISQSKKIDYNGDMSEHTEVSESDPVGEEIGNIIDRFLAEANNPAIYFSIDKEDNRAGGRERLFERWYQHNGNNTQYFFGVYPVESAADGDCDKIGVIIPRNENLESTVDSFLLSFTY